MRISRAGCVGVFFCERGVDAMQDSYGILALGQSRLCILLLQKAHIGEVQTGTRPENARRACRAAGIPLL